MRGRVVVLVFVSTVVACSAIFCSQCDSDTDPNCIDNPPAPQNCTSCERYDKTDKCVAFVPLSYCQIERRFINTTMISLRRDCIPVMMRSTCTLLTGLGEEVRVCFETCRTHGCNSNSVVTVHPNIPSILPMLLSTHFICNLLTYLNT